MQIYKHYIKLFTLVSVLLNRFLTIFGITFKEKTERSKKILKNIILSFTVKVGSIVVGLLLVPITIEYINPTEYGIWLTLSSVVTWLSFFDIGLGNGLKNKLGESLAKGNTAEGKIYVSTTYALLAIISISIFIIYKALEHFLNWYNILNISKTEITNLNEIVVVVVAGVCIQFVAKLLNTLFIAKQESAKGELIIFIGQACVLLSIIFAKNVTEGSLEKLVWLLIFVPIAVIFISSVYYYSTSLKYIAPSLKRINFTYTKSLMSIGGLFFFIQIGVMIIFQTDNIIIARELSAEKVTDYNVTYKLFSLVYMTFAIIAGPFWSAFTDAYTKQDFKWIKNSIRRLRILWLILCFFGLPLLFLFSEFIFHIWVGNKVNISSQLSLVMCFYIAALSCLLLSMNLINGVGKIRLQFYLYAVFSIINIPLTVYLARRYDLVGVAGSKVIIFVAMNIFIWIQTNKIMNRTDSGIWSK